MEHASCHSSKKSNNHGGPRKILTWDEKLALCEQEAVKEFVATHNCQSGCNCMDKVRSLGSEGVNMICVLRESRLAGK